MFDPMKNLILLVQTPADADALNASIPGIRSSNPSAIWLIHSPAVLVDQTAANAETDRQIVAINQAIKDCIGREDYTGAESYKQQRHALTLQKATAATDGYKTMTPEQQEAATTRVFGAFWQAQPAPKMQLSMHPQHHETGEWIEMLNSLKGRWPAEMAHGNFTMAWPGQFVQRGKSGSEVASLMPERSAELGKQAMQSVITDVATPKPERKGYPAHPRFKQLCALGIDALGQIALHYKLDPNGANRLKLAHMIGKHEHANNLMDNPKV
jgi:hypothetical protein